MLTKFIFWKNASRISSAIMMVFLILKMFFENVFQKYFSIILFLGVIVLFVFLLSELMKFILKKNV
ncbi:MAG: hypothetical protein CVU05_05100 [Bacteroidetes bacterium HGW-Bacteroidetes-21]|jgi:hypothetical protein|nr:MAG: hypothetical protein CVU05_05100 [Bacteroidetes bacterium HGW-Bacteroidetes-21]